MDSHTSHISLPLSRLCADKGLHLMAFFPNSTQMLDLSTFKPLKVAYRKLAKKTKDMGVTVTKSNFRSILANDCEEGVNEDIIRAGFRKSE